MAIKYRINFLVMIIAFSNILLALAIRDVIGGRSYLVAFLTGGLPILAVLAPLIGLFLGLLDVTLSKLIVRRVDPVMIELDAPLIEEVRSPYVGRGYLGVAGNWVYVLGEESIRGVFLMLVKDAWPTPAVVAFGTLLFVIWRRLPMYLRVVKLLDDFAFTMLFLWGGLLSAWLAHALMNTYILWPLVRYVPKK